jgi:biotin carboxyl carrier protein
MNNEFIHEDSVVESKTEMQTDGVKVTIGEDTFDLKKVSPHKYSINFNGDIRTVCCVVEKDKSYVDIEGYLVELSIPSEDGNSTGLAGGVVGEKDKIFAPMPGKIVKLLVETGDEVTKKQPLVIVEAMKMEHQVNSPVDAIVKTINFKDGDQVDTETPIIELDIQE